MRSSRAPAPGARSARPGSRASSRQARDRVGLVEEHRARARTRRTRRSVHARPAARRAGVGHSVEHQRRFSVASRTGRAGAGDARDAARGRRPPARAGRAAPGCRATASGRFGLGERRGRRSRRGGGRGRARRSRALGPGSSTRSSGQASRSRIARCSSSSSGAASVVERTTTCWPGCDVQAVAGEQVRQRGGVEGLGATAAPRRARRSRRLHVREVLGAGARAARRGRSCARPAVAARKRSSSSFWPSVGDAVDRPAHGEALEQELDRALPGVLLRERARRRRTSAYCRARLRRQRAAQRRATARRRGDVSRSAARCGGSAPPRARRDALAHRSARRRRRGARAARARRRSAGRRGRARRPRAPAPRACGSTRAPARCPG